MLIFPMSGSNTNGRPHQLINIFFTVFKCSMTSGTRKAIDINKHIHTGADIYVYVYIYLCIYIFMYIYVCVYKYTTDKKYARFGKHDGNTRI